MTRASSRYQMRDGLRMALYPPADVFLCFSSCHSELLCPAQQSQAPHAAFAIYPTLRFCRMGLCERTRQSQPSESGWLPLSSSAPPSLVCPYLTGPDINWSASVALLGNHDNKQRHPSLTCVFHPVFCDAFDDRFPWKHKAVIVCSKRNTGITKPSAVSSTLPSCLSAQENLSCQCRGWSIFWSSFKCLVWKKMCYSKMQITQLRSLAWVAITEG